MCRLASGTAILNYRNPHSAYNDKGGKEYSQYVTEFLHKRAKIESFNRLPELIFPFLCVQFVNKFYICR